MAETERTITASRTAIEEGSLKPTISIVIDNNMPERAKQPSIDLDKVTPRTARMHPTLIATLGEAIRQAGTPSKPGLVYIFLKKQGINVGKYEEKYVTASGKRRKARRFYVLREDLQKIIPAVQAFTDIETARKRMEKSPKLYVPLFELIQDTGAHISSQGAALALRERHFEVATSRSSTQMVLKTDKSKISELLNSMDFLNPQTLEDHPELYPSLGNVIKESGIPVLPGEVAELLPYFKIAIRIVEGDSSKRYIVREQDRAKIIEFLRGLGKDLLTKPRNGS